MTQQRRSFTAEFKREAADLVLKQNYSYIEARRSLGVGESAPRRWVDQVQEEHKGVTPQSKALTPEQQKIQELEARIARLQREKSMLRPRVETHDGKTQDVSSARLRLSCQLSRDPACRYV